MDATTAGESPLPGDLQASPHIAGTVPPSGSGQAPVFIRVCVAATILFRTDLVQTRIFVHQYSAIVAWLHRIGM